MGARRLAPAVLLLAAIAFKTPVLAAEVPEAAPEGIVSSILIEGSVNVKPEDISSRLKTRIGANLTRDSLREDVKEIWAMERFEDVSVEVLSTEDGYRVIFLVKEHPKIRKISFVGVKALGDRDTTEGFPIRDGQFYDPVKAKEGIQRLLQAYREKGYPDASVTFDLVPSGKGKGEMDLVVTAVEGLRMHVRAISFEGNEAFPDDVLKKPLKNKERSFFFQSGLFLRDELEADKGRLVAFYKDEGYQKAKVTGFEVIPVEDDEKKKKVDLKFTVEEGLQYAVRSISFEGGALATEKELRKSLELAAGEKLSQRKLDAGIGRIREIYSTRGYIYASQEPVITFDDEKAEADVVIRIREGDVAYLDRILVRGNEETKDKVILREVVTKPGDIFDTDKIRRSQERIYNLGFFEDVRVYTEPSLNAGKENLVFEVKERQTGTVSLGGGYSSQDGLVGFLQLTKANLFGLGIRIGAEWEIGSRRKNLQIDYFDPYFLDSPVSLGLGFWDTDRDLLNTGFREHSTGGSLEFGRRFLDYWRITLGYRYQLDDVDPTVDTDGDGTIDNEDLPTGVSGEKLATSSPSLSLSYDTRDNIFDPMRGWSHRLFAQVAGGPVRGLDLLGGDTQYYKLLYDLSYFQPSPRVPVLPEPTLALHTRVGRVWGFGDDRGVFGEGVPIFERFFLGGTDSIRGYEERLLGPRDPVTGQPAGGLAMWQFNAELKWPLVRRVLTLALPFYDIGNSWMRFPPFDEIDSNQNPLAESFGVGIRLTVPGTIILIRVDYGWGRTDAYDPPPSGKLHFNIGNIF